MFITQVYFKVPQDTKLITTHFFMMKIPHKREFQQITINHSSGIDFKYFIKIYNKSTAKPYYFLVNNTTLQLNISLDFRQKLLGRIYHKSLQFMNRLEINREAAKISTLPSSKIDKYEYLTDEERLFSDNF